MTTKEWMKRKIKGLNHERMNEFVDIISKNSGKKKWFIKLDIYKNFLTRGIGYTDYFRGNYISLTNKEKDTFVTTKSYYKMISYFNDERYEILLHDKLLFNTFFKEYIKRDYINLKECSVEEFKKFLKDKEIVFAKVPTGEGGHGVSKINVKNEDLKKLYDRLKENKQYLVEEAIIQSKDVDEINPNVVNSFRIVTLYKEGNIYIIANAFRINQDKNDVIGCTNDLYFSLNEEGIIDSNVIDDYANIYEEHPLTKKKFRDVKIKGVKEAFELVKRAAKKIPEVRFIGWDVAFSINGPVIVEANEYPGYGLHQFYALKNSKTGLKKEIEQYIGGEITKFK